MTAFYVLLTWPSNGAVLLAFALGMFVMDLLHLWTRERKNRKAHMPNPRG